jgi:Fe-S-cluster containining protein
MMNKPDQKTNEKSSVRLDADHAFQFSCKPGIPCFTQCCGDVNIVLTPYDVIRMKNALGISSGEFLDKYTVIVTTEDRLIPMVLLKMEEQTKRCLLVSGDGCRIYKDRPWACRMFPLDMVDDGTFRVLTDVSRCKGLSGKERRRISEWLIEQGVPIYDEMNQLFSEITSPLQAQKLDIDNPKIFKMVFMALYNIDRFKDFVFQSSFLDRFDLDPIRIKKIEENDLELLKFSIDWIKFGLFGQKTLKLKPQSPT